jgi:pyruvate formate lyase activating enzyme
MNIGGFQKTSLLDYPDSISAIVWTTGCNFRCPFCYNKDLVLGKVKNIAEEEVISFLSKRKGLLEGLVISGGEPLIQKDIVKFCEKVKKIGYLIKIDTNGMYPKIIQDLIDKKIVDYIAMDVKAPKEKYNGLTGVKTDINNLEKSIRIIKKSAPDYEFKTTFVPVLLNKEDIIEIAKWLEGAKRFFLQQFKPNTPLISDKLEIVKPYSKEEILSILKKIKPYFEICNTRGI